MTRRPGRPYGIHINACIHATYAASSNAGHVHGNGNTAPAARMNAAKITHTASVDVVAYSIGQNANAALLTGIVKKRVGYRECRPDRSPVRPCVNTPTR